METDATEWCTFMPIRMMPGVCLSPCLCSTTRPVSGTEGPVYPAHHLYCMCIYVYVYDIGAGADYSAPGKSTGKADGAFRLVCAPQM